MQMQICPLLRDVSNNITIDFLAYELKNLNALNASNVTSGTLSVSRGGAGVSSLSVGQIIIGNGFKVLASVCRLTPCTVDDKNKTKFADLPVDIIQVISNHVTN